MREILLCYAITEEELHLQWGNQYIIQRMKLDISANQSAKHRDRVFIIAKHIFRQCLVKRSEFSSDLECS